MNHCTAVAYQVLIQQFVCLFACFFTRINVHCWNIIEMPKINGGRHYGLRKEAPYAKANARLILQPLRMKAKKCLRHSKETGWPCLTQLSCANLQKKLNCLIQYQKIKMFSPISLISRFTIKLSKYSLQAIHQEIQLQ